MTEGDMTVHNLLDQGKFPEGEVEHRGEATRSILGGCLDWLSFTVDAVLPFPMVCDVRCALNNKRNIILLLSFIAAFNAVVVS